MSEVNVGYAGGIKFVASARRHSVTIDLPQDKGGEDSGMTPPEAFMASLGSCIGVYVVRYCENAKLDPRGLKVRLGWTVSDDKKRIDRIDAVLTLPNAEVGKRKDALLAVARHCLIHNTILGEPAIDIHLE